jgi:hypothetical protein
LSVAETALPLSKATFGDRDFDGEPFDIDPVFLVGQSNKGSKDWVADDHCQQVHLLDDRNLVAVVQPKLLELIAPGAAAEALGGQPLAVLS